MKSRNSAILIMFTVIGIWYTTIRRRNEGVWIMKEKFQKLVRKCDTLLGWTLLFYILITSILLYVIFTDFTNAAEFIYNAF